MLFSKKKKDDVCKNYDNGMCSLVLELKELSKREKELEEKLEKENDIYTLPLDNLWKFWTSHHLGFVSSENGWNMNGAPSRTRYNLRVISLALEELPDFNAFIDEWGLLYEVIMGNQKTKMELSKIRTRQSEIKKELGIE